MRAITADVMNTSAAQGHLYAAGVVAVTRAGCEDDLIHRFGS